MAPQIFIVLRGNYAADDYHDILPPSLAKLVHQLGEQRFMSGGERTHAYNVNVIVHRILRRLFRRLKERPHVHVESHIGISGGNHLGAPVVTVLPHLRDQDAGAPALRLFKIIGHPANLRNDILVGELTAVNSGDGAYDGLMTAADFLHRVRDFPEAGPLAGRLHRQFKKVSLAALHGAGDGVQSSADLTVVSVRPELGKPVDLRLADGGVIDLQSVQGVLFVEPKGVYSDYLLAAGVNAGLPSGGRLFDTHLWQTCLNGPGHASQLLYLLNMGPPLANKTVGEVLHVIRTSPGIDYLADACFILDVELGVPRYAGRKVGRQGDGFVKGVGVKGLGVPEGGGHSLNARPCHVVERILSGQAPPGGLAVGAERHGFRALRPETFDYLCPQHPGGAHLRHFHEIVFANSPEEGESRGEAVDLKSRRAARAKIFQSVRQGVGEFDIGRGPRLLHVVAGDAYAVELRHMPGGVCEDVADNAHGGRRRVDIRIADHEFF